MKILLDIPDDYAEALMLLSVSLGRRSRNKLIQDILQAYVDGNPEVLEKARNPPVLKVSQIERPEFPVMVEEDRYIFTRNDGEEIEGRGRTPIEALAQALGREVTAEEYRQEYRGNRLV